MPAPTPTLPTARLRLRPFRDADADALWALHSNAHVLRYWDSPPWSEPARAQRFIAVCGQMAETHTRNAASARVLEKLGFVREGTLREDCVVDGEVSDSWVYGLLRREWVTSARTEPDA